MDYVWLTMDKINKTVKYNSLFMIYKNLLTDTQRDIMDMYFAYDLSLSEISEERNISRAAAEDAIKKSMAKLDEYESALHLYEKRANILKKTAELKQKVKNTEVLHDILDIEKEL